MIKDDDISVAIAQTIKEFRAKKEYSQIDLAEESGIHRTMIEKIETSNRRPTLHTIIKICSGLSISLSDFSKRLEEILEKK